MDLDQIPALPHHPAGHRPGVRARWAGRTGGGPQPAGLAIVVRDPALERVVELSRTLVAVLVSTFATAVGLALAGWADSPGGWAVLGLSGLVGLSPLPWYRHRARRSGRLPVWELDPGQARLVTAAAEEANTLRRLAERAPAGPVADHLDHLANTAHGYVVALHQAAVQSSVAGRGRTDAELEATMTRVVGQLADLTAAAGRLREAQRRHLQVSPLEQLAEATDRLAAALEHPTSTHRTDRPSGP